MIGRLRGTLECIARDHIIIDVQGVGYVVHCPASIMQTHMTGDVLSLFITTQVREDAITLYGFEHPVQQEWFALLTSVKGVGSKMAIAILSHLLPQQLRMAVYSEDVSAFRSVQGVGPKIAARIISELSGAQLPQENVEDSGNMRMETVKKSGPAKRDDGKVPSQTSRAPVLDDTLLALEGLGYSRSEAFSVVQRVLADNNDITLEECIKRSLSLLSG